MDKILRNTVVPVPEGQADEYESVEKEEVEGKLGELELVRADIHIEDGEIAAIQPAGNGAGVEANEDVETFDVDHGLVLPGGVDVHVHFREPGATHKEDWLSGSESAAAGGVTTVVDQPNTDPPTVTGEAFDVKRERAENSIVDYGINAGVTEDW
ncbi:MAG: amidohydrolase family protein, partial [Halobacteria archaeon]